LKSGQVQHACSGFNFEKGTTMELKKDGAGARQHRASREYEFDAMIFDLDGVITSTAKLHFDGWKV
jgi:hypothetical protein